MPTQVIMLQLGESVVEGTVTKWFKQVGDSIEEFEPIVEVNTDKVDTEIPSPVEGTLLKILVDEGTTVNAGVILAWIGAADEVIPDQTIVQEVQKTESTQKDIPGDSFISPTVEARTSESPESIDKAERTRELGFISPVVAKISAEHNIDLTKIQGTGQKGRITKKDLLVYIEAQKSTPIWETPADGDLFRPTELVFSKEESKLTPGTLSRNGDDILPLTPIRRIIAKHMVSSKHTSPHVTTIMEADLSQVVAHRVQNKLIFAKDGVKLTFTAYFVAASVSGLQSHPIVNSSWGDEGIRLHRNINIGIATSLGEEGLIVPVIKSADGLSLLVP